MEGHDLLLSYLSGEDITEYLLSAVKEHMLTGDKLDNILKLSTSSPISPRRKALLQRRGYCLIAAFETLKQKHDLSDRQTCVLLYDAIVSESEQDGLSYLISEINLCSALLHITWTSPDSLYNTIVNYKYSKQV